MKKNRKTLLTICFVITSLAPFLLAQECNVIYVTPNGAGSGLAGTRANPASLSFGLTLATGGNSRLWLASGIYNTNAEIMLVNNVTIEGGFDALTWIKSNVPPTVIHRNMQIVLPPPANGTAIFAGLNVSGFRLQDLTLNMDIPNGVAATAYGIYLNGCSNYSIVRCDVGSADGTPGIAGSAGAPGAPGAAGAVGPAGNPNEIFSPGGAGGAGANSGGQGARCGDWDPSGHPLGSTGGGACGGAGGANGSGPSASFFNQTPSCGSASAGQNGNPGGPGTPAGAAGPNGPAGTIVIPGYFVPGGLGINGSSGVSGCGGGGGGGGGGRQRFSSLDDVGGGGGGGGGGGFGGAGGTGGTGGGGSFAIFLFNNGAGGNIIDCKLTPGLGGAGGTGGSGGAGGVGGAGGAGGAAGCGPNPGGSGGAGGAGSVGGQGGNGSAGLSMALSETAGTPVSQSNISLVPGNPPVLSVNNHGCTNAEVTFNTPIAGAWNFGSGATPSSANTAGPVSVIYNSIGRKTISIGGTTFTDFIEIFRPALTDTILHIQIPTITGCPDTFSTTLTGSLYDWDFGPAAIPASLSITTPNAPVVFTAPGIYTVTVWITTTCCGRVKDSLVINVLPNTLNITLIPDTNSICEGDPINYTANPPGYQSYTFLVNNIPVQTSASNTYSAGSLAPGDSVRVLGFDGSCYSNPSATHYPLVTPFPLASISSSDINDTICAGDQVTFTTSPTGLDSYEFYNGASQQQSSSNNEWITTALSQGNSVYVIATDNGCRSLPSNLITTFVKPVPIMTITVPGQTICQGDNVIVTASPSGLDNYEFNVNGNSVQNSNSNIFSSSTFSDGDQIVVTGSLNGCISQASSTLTMTVNPIPSVTLSSSETDDSICQGTSVLFSAIPGGYDNYAFSDGGIVVQNSPSPTYTTNLLATGNAITVIATQLGCSSAGSNAIVTVISPAPVVSAGADQTSCIDTGFITLGGFNPTGGTWSGTGISNASGIFDPLTAGPGSHSLVYSYTDLFSGCAGYDSILFTINSLPVIVLAPSYDICSGQSVQLNAGGGIVYTWSPPIYLSNSGIQNPVADPAATTAYQVTVTDINDCSNTAGTVVNVNPIPTAEFNVNQVCEGMPSIFSNGSMPISGNSYSWNFGDGNSSADNNPSHTYVTADSFAVTLIAQLGNCFDTITKTTIVFPTAFADFDATPLVSFSDNTIPVQFSDHSLNAESWNWNFGDGNFSIIASPSHFYAQPGTYTVTLIADNPYGCSDTLIKQNYISVYQTPKVFVPNVFTPNGDGNNDVLTVMTTDVKFFEFKIFNRWGEKVFESNNNNQGWDGIYKGNKAPGGVYTYNCKIVFFDDSSRDLKGSVMLIK